MKLNLIKADRFKRDEVQAIGLTGIAPIMSDNNIQIDIYRKCITMSIDLNSSIPNLFMHMIDNNKIDAFSVEVGTRLN